MVTNAQSPKFKIPSPIQAIVHPSSNNVKNDNVKMASIVNSTQFKIPNPLGVKVQPEIKNEYVATLFSQKERMDKRHYDTR